MHDGIRTPLGTHCEQILLAKFTVSNLRRSYDFYTQIVGLKWALTRGQEQPPPPVTDATKQPDFVEIPLNFSASLADPFFVLVQQRGDAPSWSASRMSWIGFKVPDAPAIVRRVGLAGYDIVREAVAVGPDQMSIGIVRDPDGYTVEFIQSATYPNDAR